MDTEEKVGTRMQVDNISSSKDENGKYSAVGYLDGQKWSVDSKYNNDHEAIQALLKHIINTLEGKENEEE